MIDRLKRPANGRTLFRRWCVLTVATAASAALATPYLVELLGDQLEAASEERAKRGLPRLTPTRLAMIRAKRATVIGAPCAAVGVLIGPAVGLDGAARIGGLPSPRLRSAAWRGALAGASIVLLDRTVFLRSARRLEAETPTPDAWRVLLASAYGSIGEEVIARLGLQTAATAIALWAVQPLSEDIRTTHAARWAGLALADAAFAIGHLPVVRATPGLDVKARVLTLNALAGWVFGRVYWLDGIEAAMVAHATTDITINLLPATARLLASAVVTPS